MTKILVPFLVLCFLTPFYLLSPPQLESQEILKHLIDNIFYNKPLNDIVSGILSSVISDNLIQFFIEPSKSKKKSPKMVYRQRCYKNFDKLQFRVDLIKVNWSSFCHDPETKNP